MAVFRIEDLSIEMCDKLELEAQNEKLLKVVSELKSEISLKDKKCEDLESQTEDLKSVNEDLEDNIGDLEDKILDLEEEIEDLEDKNKDLGNKIGDLESKNEKLRKLIILVNSLTSTIAQQA